MTNNGNASDENALHSQARILSPATRARKQATVFGSAERSTSAILLNLEVILHRFDAIGLPRDRNGLVGFFLTVCGSTRPDDPILIGVNLNVLHAAGMLCCKFSARSCHASLTGSMARPYCVVI